MYTPVREYPPLADRKAVAVLATNGLMLSVLLFFSEAIHGVVVGGEDRFGIGRYVVILAVVPFAIALLIGSWAAFRALTMPMPAMPTSMAFFGDIVRLDREEYRSRVKGISYREALTDILHYNYSLAILSLAKFRRINRAIICSKTMVPLWVSILLVLTALRS